jgi:hypothetical protein
MDKLAHTSESPSELQIPPITQETVEALSVQVEADLLSPARSRDG